MQEKTTIKLSVPILVHDVETSELQMSAPTLGLLRGIKKDASETDILLTIIQRLAGIPPTSVDQISFLDREAIQDFLETFIGSGEKT